MDPGDIPLLGPMLGGAVNEAARPKCVNLSKLVKDAGWSGNEARITQAVVFAESSGNPNAENACCVGLMQVHFEAHKDKFNIKSRDELKDPIRNLEIAYRIYKDAGGKWSKTGMNPWEGYGNGNYRAFLGKDKCIDMSGAGADFGPLNDMASGASDGVGAALAVIAQLFKALTDARTYLRAGKVTIGTVFTILGVLALLLVGLTAVMGVVPTPMGKAAKALKKAS